MTYDYVIVGAGSAGCVLAHRLTDDPAVSVLVLEAGGEDIAPEIHDPQGWPLLLGTEVDWDYATVPQTHAAFRRVPWPRGKVVGGSSCLNAMVYMRGTRSDYDTWGLLGNGGWDYDSLLPMFRAIEDYPDGDPEYRGVGGPLRMRIPSEVNPLSEAVVEGAQQQGIPYNADFNGETVHGVGWNQLTVYEGKRQSAAVAYLKPALQRDNLTLLTKAHTTRLIVNAAGRVTAVEYVKDGSVERADVGVEAIVSCGAIESPKLLMLSGIGPADELRSWGIEPRIALPGVGQNLHDHPGVGVTFESLKPIPPGLNQNSEVGMYVKGDPELMYPDLQYGMLHVPFVAEGFSAPDQAFSFYPCLLKPRSRGWVRLQSASPFDKPACNPNYLQEEVDMRSMVRSIEVSRELARSDALKEWTGPEVVPGPDMTDDAELRRYVAQAVGTWFHPVGTCKMGVDDMAVVDSKLRVYGAENLRVIDASIMPEITSGNTNAPTLAIAWKGADMLQAAAR
jgi:choline dehydrogenase